MAHRGRQNADEVLAAALAAGQPLRDAVATHRWADPDVRHSVVAQWLDHNKFRRDNAD